MSKVMFVTVGTSLFHSASWDAEAIRHDVQHYHQWTADAKLLKNPEERKRSPEGRGIQKRLEEILTPINATRWTSCLARDLLSGDPDLNTVMRYSAELATILKLFENEVEKIASLEKFLRSYGSIYLVCDSRGQDRARLPYIAAHHLANALNHLAGGNEVARVFGVDGLSSTSSEVLLRSPTRGLGYLVKYIVSNPDQALQMDLVVSGGYKLYGIVLAGLLRLEDRVSRLLYIHEEGERLIQIPETMRDAGELASMSAATKEELEKAVLNIGLL